MATRSSKKPAVPRPAVIDFETLPIRPRPHYPPAPVSVSIIMPGKKPKDYRWGHLDGNNCSWGEARAALQAAYDASPDGILCQNGKFDVDVADVHMGLPVPHWSKIQDSMFLLYLDDPHQRELGLKPSAARLLGEAPDERDAVVDWLVQHQPLAHLGIKMGSATKGKNYAGAYVAFAPGDIVGKYANGDTGRTERIFNILWPSIVDRGMLPAYERERELMPILLEMERDGIRLDVKRLRTDFDNFTRIHAELYAWIAKRLKTPDINLDSGVQVIKALIDAGLADMSKIGVTASGQYKSDKETLNVAVSDPVLKATLRYATSLGTCLRTFMGPWLAIAEQTGGFIYTTWNQVRGGDPGGTRTGRLSSTPNFQNIPKVFTPVWLHHAHTLEDPSDKRELAKLVKCPHKDLPPLPRVRSYIIAYADDEILYDRDYSQQELRILAHFEDGEMCANYRENPWLDLHDFARELINRMLGTNFTRKPIKNTGFGIIYGMGNGLLAEKSDTTVEEAKKAKDAYLNTFPGIKVIGKAMKAKYKANEPLYTWGGREYYCEPPRIIDGRVQHFDYKMMNVLIQGSAADNTKEAIIRTHRNKLPTDRILLNIHDQLTGSCKKTTVVESMARMKESMESVKFDVPMLSEGAIGYNWVDLKDYDKKGKSLYTDKLLKQFLEVH